MVYGTTVDYNNITIISEFVVNSRIYFPANSFMSLSVVKLMSTQIIKVNFSETTFSFKTE